MKQPLLLILIMGVLLLLQSCFISREPQYDLRNIDRSELYAIRTVTLPMLIARPIVKLHLKNEHCSKELRRYVNRIRAVQVTVAATRNDFNVTDFTAMATSAPYENWMSVNAYGNRVYINAIEKNNTIRKMNIMVAAKDNALVYVMLECRLSAEDLSGLISVLLNDEEAVTGWMRKIGSQGTGKEL
jgi:hypothetical protein